MVTEAATAFTICFIVFMVVIWYVTLLLIHFCTLSSGCNAYQDCVDDLPSCQGQLCVDVSWWQAVGLLLLLQKDDVRQLQAGWPLHPTPGPQVLHSIFPTVGRCRPRTHFQVNVSMGCSCKGSELLTSVIIDIWSIHCFWWCLQMCISTELKMHKYLWGPKLSICSVYCGFIIFQSFFCFSFYYHCGL